MEFLDLISFKIFVYSFYIDGGLFKEYGDSDGGFFLYMWVWSNVDCKVGFFFIVYIGFLSVFGICFIRVI